jgi:ribosomal protein S18 acetylase RimI-like enzyme
MKPPEDLVIRTITHGELPRLLDMIHALAAHHGDVATLTLDDLRRDVRGPSPWFKVLVAARHGELIGFAALYRLGQLVFAKRGLDLHHLYVDPDHRRQGIGYALIQAAVRTAKDSNCSYITLGTSPDNTEAQQTYLNFGFKDAASVGRRFRLELNTG